MVGHHRPAEGLDLTVCARRAIEKVDKIQQPLLSIFECAQCRIYVLKDVFFLVMVVVIGAEASLTPLLKVRRRISTSARDAPGLPDFDTAKAFQGLVSSRAGWVLLQAESL